MSVGDRLRQLAASVGREPARRPGRLWPQNGHNGRVPVIPARLRLERRVEDALAGPAGALRAARSAVAARARVVGAVGARVGLRPRHLAVAAVAAFVVGLALQALHHHGSARAAPASTLRASVEADIPTAAPPAVGSVGQVAVPALRRERRRHHHRAHRSTQVNTAATASPAPAPTATPTATPPALVVATPTPTAVPVAPAPAPVSAPPEPSAPARGPSFDSSG